MTALRSALVQAAHLIADALELSRSDETLGSVRAAHPKAIAKTKPRKQQRKPYRPTTPPSELDVARAIKAARKAGINLP